MVQSPWLRVVVVVGSWGKVYSQTQIEREEESADLASYQPLVPLRNAIDSLYSAFVM